MRIKIENKEGLVLLNCEFSNISIEDKIYSITLGTNYALDLNLENDTLYNITFIDSENLNLIGTYPMIYLSYHFSASTAFTIDESGDKIATVLVNSNAITLKKF